MGEVFRVVAHVPAGTPATVWDVAVLSHDERRVRRRVLTLSRGAEIALDLPQTVTLMHGDSLQLEDGRLAGIVARDEALYDIRGRDPKHLLELAWHIGNRHTKAEITPERILILRDHVLRDMLRGLGASVSEITAPFSPLDGAYNHDHSHALLNR